MIRAWIAYISLLIMWIALVLSVSWTMDRLFKEGAAFGQPACPCMGMPLFTSTLACPVLACTHEPPGQYQYMRLVRPTGEIAVAFELQARLWCGAQAPGPQSYTMAMPVEWGEYKACRQLIEQAALRCGVRCWQDR